MPNGVISGMVQCPFYLTDCTHGSYSLTCEGYEGCEKLRSVFRNYGQLTDHVQHFCADRYKECPVYHTAMIKYGDED